MNSKNTIQQQIKDYDTMHHEMLTTITQKEKAVS